MALRLMQFFLPRVEDGQVERLLEDREVLGTWHDSVERERVMLQLLVPAEETEPITDRFEQEFGQRERFRVVLFPVEAVLPREAADENGEESATPETAEENESGQADRVSREELYAEVTDTLGLTRVFVAMTLLSAIVAAVGLLRDDVAVIIGAMVIAPLLGPNVAMALAVTLGDLSLLRRAAITSVAGMSIALVLAVVMGFVLGVDPRVPAIDDRTAAGLTDIVLALAAGAAGTFAFTRGYAQAVIGVMVAVALLPPLVACGMLLGAGLFQAAWGAALLTGANVICINLAGVGTFALQGVRARNWWEARQAKQATRVAVAIWIALLLLLMLILYVTRYFTG